MPRVNFTSSDETESDVDETDHQSENALYHFLQLDSNVCFFFISRLGYKCRGR